jgi:Kyakuja-Dileera-Zisupton transposase
VSKRRFIHIKIDNSPPHSRLTIHVCLDGNFHQKHRKASGAGHHFYVPQLFISKTQVDAVDKRLDELRKRPVRQTNIDENYETAIDTCENSHEAANGKRVKANAELFDDTGIMALLCRHDEPLFVANIDTPGEQQKYSVALIEELFRHLPSHSRVCALYDVGCVLDRSRHKVYFQ